MKNPKRKEAPRPAPTYGTRDVDTSSLPKEFREFFLHFQPVDIHHFYSLEKSFAFYHMRHVFEVVTFFHKVRKQKAFAFVMVLNKSFPENVIVLDDSRFRVILKNCYDVNRDTQPSGFGELLVAYPASSRYMKALEEIQHLVFNHDRTIAARFLGEKDFTANLVSRYASALYNFHYHAARLLQQPDLAVHELDSEMVCPFCHSLIGDAESQICEQCATVHHADCWQQAGRCVVFGCK